MDTLWQDLRYGFRMLFRNPAFTVVAVITVALGIGANSSIFSVVNAILLRPLGYQQPERLVVLNHNYPKLDLKASVSAVGFRHYVEVNRSFETMAALTGWNVNLTGTGEPERLEGMTVTPSFFDTLGVQPVKGRVFSPDEAEEGREHVVIISDGLWRRRFGADSNLIDSTVTLNGESYTVVGIMPEGFQFGREFGFAVDIWSPLTFTPDQLQPSRWRNEFLTVVARLKPGVTFTQAQADMDAVAADIRARFFGENDAADPTRWGLLLTPLNDLVVGDIRLSLIVLMAAVGLVLLIACANVANLLLARSAVRQKEIALRVAVGAGRLRVIRQLLTESVLLSLVGGVLGLVLAYAGLKTLVALNQANIPRSYEIRIDGAVLAFTFLVSLLTGVVFGLVPALHSSKNDLHEALKEGGRSAGGGVRPIVRSTLVVVETAIALVLLIGAGLLIKSFARLQDVKAGFRHENLLVMQIALPTFKYREAHQIDGFYQEVLERVKAITGVESAGISSSLPMSPNSSSGSFTIEGRQVGPGEMSPWGNRWSAGATYFQTMGIPLIAGRYFDDRDVMTAPLVAVIDETMSQKYWPDENPIGRRISFERDQQGNPRWREIVGVVGHVKHKGLEGDSPVQYYFPQRQRPTGSVFMVVRSASDPKNLAGSVRGAIRSVDADLPVFKVTTMEQMVSDSVAKRRFSMLLLGIFAAVALVLATVGLYGLISYSVTQRTHEIGIRMALGAREADVLTMVIGRGLLLSLIGLGVGLVAALFLTRLIRNLLFSVGPTDPQVFIWIAVLLSAVSMIASLAPARRAIRVDPIVALRYE